MKMTGITQLKIVCLAALLMLCAACKDHIASGTEAYKKGEFLAAFTELTPLAEEGNSVAQLMVGFMYDNGEGVKQDYEKAVYWYTKAAEQGSAEAQYNLGVMYGNGLGVKQDWVQGFKWISLAVVLGNQEAAPGIAKAQSFMTPAQIKESQALVEAWLAQHKNN